MMVRYAIEGRKRVQEPNSRIPSPTTPTPATVHANQRATAYSPRSPHVTPENPPKNHALKSHAMAAFLVAMR